MPRLATMSSLTVCAQHGVKLPPRTRGQNLNASAALATLCQLYADSVSTVDTTSVTTVTHADTHGDPTSEPNGKRTPRPQLLLTGIRISRQSHVDGVALAAVNMKQEFQGWLDRRASEAATFAPLLTVRDVYAAFVPAGNGYEVQTYLTFSHWKDARAARVVLRPRAVTIRQRVAAALRQTFLRATVTVTDSQEVHLPKRRALLHSSTHERRPAPHSQITRLRREMDLALQSVHTAARMTTDKLQMTQEIIVAHLESHGLLVQPIVHDEPDALAQPSFDSPGAVAANVPYFAPAQCHNTEEEDMSSNVSQEAPSDVENNLALEDLDDDRPLSDNEHDVPPSVSTVQWLSRDLQPAPDQPIRLPEQRNPHFSVPFRQGRLHIGEDDRRFCGQRNRMPEEARYFLSSETSYGTKCQDKLADKAATTGGNAGGQPAPATADTWRQRNRKHRLSTIKRWTTPTAHAGGSATPMACRLARMSPDLLLSNCFEGYLPTAKVFTGPASVIGKPALAIPITAIPSTRLAPPEFHRVLIPFDRDKITHGDPHSIRAVTQIGKTCGMAAVASLLGRHVSSLATVAQLNCAVQHLRQTLNAETHSLTDGESAAQVAQLLPEAAHFGATYCEALAKLLWDADPSSYQLPNSPIHDWGAAEVSLVLALHGIPHEIRSPADSTSSPATDATAYLITDGLHWRALLKGWVRGPDTVIYDRWYLICSIEGIKEVTSAERSDLLAKLAHIVLRSCRAMMPTAEPHGRSRDEPMPQRVTQKMAESFAKSMARIAKPRLVHLENADDRAPWDYQRPTRVPTQLPLLSVQCDKEVRLVVLVDWLRLDQLLEACPDGSSPPPKLTNFFPTTGRTG